MYRRTREGFGKVTIRSFSILFFLQIIEKLLEIKIITCNVQQWIKLIRFFIKVKDQSFKFGENTDSINAIDECRDPFIFI